MRPWRYRIKQGHVLTKHKKPFTDGGIVKEVVIAMAIETLFKDDRSKTEIKSAIANVQFGGKESVCCLQIRPDRWTGTRQDAVFSVFLVQWCLMMVIWMAFDDFLFVCLHCF